MAVRWKVDKEKWTGGNLYYFDPKEIIVIPGENGRHADPDIEWMIADIHARGQETPVTVRNDGGKPVLVFGYQRLRAIREVNKRWPREPKRQIACVFKELDKEESFVANIAENRMRNDTTPVDDAHNIKRLRNVYGYNDEKVIHAYFPHLVLGKSSPKDWEDARRWVRERAAIIGLAPGAEKAVREGKVKLHTAIQLNKLPEAKQEEVVALGGWVKGTDVALAAGKPAPTPRKAAAPAPVKPWEQVQEQYRNDSAEQAAQVERSRASLGLFADEVAPPAKPGERPWKPLTEKQIEEKPFVESVQNLGAGMLEELGVDLWNPDRDKTPRPELLEFFDAVLAAAAQCSARYDFGSEVLEDMEAYRKARVAHART